MQIQKFCALGMVLAFSHLSADEFHNVNQIVGDRSIGMAGAYGAISDDPSGMVFNPAGVAYSNSASMSANVNTLQWTQITYKDALQQTYDYQRSSYQVLPNFFGVVQPFGNYVIGFSSAIVDSSQEKQDQSFENLANIDRFVVNLNNLKTTYNIGPSIAKKINSTFSIGVSVPFHYRSSEFISNQNIVFSDTVSNSLEWVNVYLKKSEQGIRPRFGMMWNPFSKVSLGIVIDQTYVFRAKQSLQESQCVTNSIETGCATQVNPKITEFNYLPRYPVQTRIAGAWFPNNALLLSSDFIYNSAVDASTGFPAKQATYDAAVGLEWYWSPRWALRSGAYTSMANTLIPSKDLSNQNPHINRYGGTISVARFSQGSSISIGMQSLYGVGDSQLFGSGKLQETTMLDINLFFTTSYRY